MRLPALLLVGAASASAVGGQDPAVCLREALTSWEVGKLLEDAIAVLRASGRAPSAYRLELRTEGPLAVAGTGRAREVSAIFEPLDVERDHAVAVTAGDPCMVSWVWSPGRWTPWQLEVLERARQHAGTAWRDGDLADVRVTESRDHVGVRLTSVEGEDLRIVMRKSDLVVIDPPLGRAEDRDAERGVR